MEREHLAEIRRWAAGSEFVFKSYVDQALGEQGQLAVNLLRSLLRDGTADDLRQTLRVLAEAFGNAESEANAAHREVAEVVIGTSVALSAGVVAWLLRGGALLAALLSATPAWASFDPIPVILRRRTRRDDREDALTPEDAAAEQALARILRPDVRREPPASQAP
jgi:hypothetical protein